MVDLSSSLCKRLPEGNQRLPRTAPQLEWSLVWLKAIRAIRALWFQRWVTSNTNAVKNAKIFMGEMDRLHMEFPEISFMLEPNDRFHPWQCWKETSIIGDKIHLFLWPCQPFSLQLVGSSWVPCSDPTISPRQEPIVPGCIATVL